MKILYQLTENDESLLNDIQHQLDSATDFYQYYFGLSISNHRRFFDLHSVIIGFDYTDICNRWECKYSTHPTIFVSKNVLKAIINFIRRNSISFKLEK